MALGHVSGTCGVSLDYVFGFVGEFVSDMFRRLCLVGLWDTCGALLGVCGVVFGPVLGVDVFMFFDP